MVSTVAFPEWSTLQCGLGLNGYLMFLGKLLGYTSRDIGEIVATTASKAIADAIEAAKGVESVQSSQGDSRALGRSTQRVGCHRRLVPDVSEIHEASDGDTGMPRSVCRH